jgi:hypothetical protein
MGAKWKEKNSRLCSLLAVGVHLFALSETFSDNKEKTTREY